MGKKTSPEDIAKNCLGSWASIFHMIGMSAQTRLLHIETLSFPS